MIYEASYLGALDMRLSCLDTSSRTHLSIPPCIFKCRSKGRLSSATQLNSTPSSVTTEACLLSQVQRQYRFRASMAHDWASKFLTSKQNLFHCANNLSFPPQKQIASKGMDAKGETNQQSTESNPCLLRKTQREHPQGSPCLAVG